MNLVNVLKEIRNEINKLEIEKEKEIKELSEKYDRMIEYLKVAYEANLKINTTCTECFGRGELKLYSYDNPVQFEIRSVKCPRCKGSGMEPKNL